MKKVRIFTGLFVQCHALVRISISGTDNEQDVSFYAKRLAERLKPLVCR